MSTQTTRRGQQGQHTVQGDSMCFMQERAPPPSLTCPLENSSGLGPWMRSGPPLLHQVLHTIQSAMPRNTPLDLL